MTKNHINRAKRSNTLDYKNIKNINKAKNIYY